MSTDPNTNPLAKAPSAGEAQQVDQKLTAAQSVFRALELTELCRELGSMPSKPVAQPKANEKKDR